MSSISNGQSSGGSSEGIVVGEVTNVDDPEQLGRVKVAYSTRTVDDESDWAPVVAPMSGEDRGTYFPFEVGDSVLIALAGGDIHRPYVLGGLWNRRAKPPVEDENQQKDLRIVRSRSGHELRLNDADSAENVEIRTGTGHSILLDDPNGTIDIEDRDGRSRVRLDSDGTIAVEGKELRLSGSTIALDATSDITISATGNVDVSGMKVNIN